MTDFNEVILFAALMTYLFANANDWVLTGVIMFILVALGGALFCSVKRVLEAKRTVEAMSQFGKRNAAGKAADSGQETSLEDKKRETENCIRDFAKRNNVSICLDDGDSTVVDDHSKDTDKKEDGDT